MTDEMPDGAALPLSAEPTERPGASVAAPRPKPGVGLVVGAIVAVVMACCCGTVGIGAVLFMRSAEDAGAPSATEVRSPSFSEEARVQEWTAWYPEPTEPLEPTPAEAATLVREGLSVVAPEFAVAESAWWPGYYDVDQDWYFSDDYYVRALHPSSDRVSAAIQLVVQSDEMVADDVALEPEGSTDVVTRIDSGTRELLYAPWWADGFTLADDYVDLWAQIGADWPDAVVVEGYADGDDDFAVTLTKWSLYAVKTDFPLVFVRYHLTGSAWELLDWKYIGAEVPAADTSTI